jgi:hypothetical protein
LSFSKTKISSGLKKAMLVDNSSPSKTNSTFKLGSL